MGFDIMVTAMQAPLYGIRLCGQSSVGAGVVMGALAALVVLVVNGARALMWWRCCRGGVGGGGVGV